MNVQEASEVTVVHKPKTFVCPEHGNETVVTIPFLEINLHGANWDLSYYDNPIQEEYAVTFKEHVTHSCMTFWFPSLMKRKEFLLLCNTRSLVNQETPGMSFANLRGSPKPLSRLHERWLEFLDLLAHNFWSKFHLDK